MGLPGSLAVVNSIGRRLLLFTLLGGGSSIRPAWCKLSKATRQLISLSPPSGFSHPRAWQTSREMRCLFILLSCRMILRMSSMSASLKVRQADSDVPSHGLFTFVKPKSFLSASEIFQGRNLANSSGFWGALPNRAQFFK